MTERFLEVTQEAGAALFARNISGEVVMLNLLRFRDVADSSANPELIAGSLPQKQRRFVEAWAEIHHAELLAAWEQLQAGRRPGKIEPLR
jgi:hypothetical protein